MHERHVCGGVGWSLVLIFEVKKELLQHEKGWREWVINVVTEV